MENGAVTICQTCFRTSAFGPIQHDVGCHANFGMKKMPVFSGYAKHGYKRTGRKRGEPIFRMENIERVTLANFKGGVN